MSKWASPYIAKLNEGEIVKFRPRGSSMTGIVNSGQLVTVTPLVENIPPVVKDVVLCTVKGAQYLHLVKAVSSDKKRFQIGNNRGGINGWTHLDKIHGIMISVEN